MKLEDLNISISEMNPDELREFIRNLRSSRTTPKKTEAKPSSKGTKKSKSPAKKVNALLENMTEEEREQFKKILLGG